MDLLGGVRSRGTTSLVLDEVTGVRIRANTNLCICVCLGGFVECLYSFV